MRIVSTIFLLLLALRLSAQEHPNLILTIEGVNSIRSNLGEVPIFDQTVIDAQEQVAVELEIGIVVPTPKDLAGGYTHERHKANFFTMQKAGVLFQITGDEKYAQYVKEMLLAYAAIYPTLGKQRNAQT